MYMPHPNFQGFIETMVNISENNTGEPGNETSCAFQYVRKDDQTLEPALVSTISVIYSSKYCTILIINGRKKMYMLHLNFQRIIGTMVSIGENNTGGPGNGTS